MNVTGLLGDSRVNSFQRKPYVLHYVYLLLAVRLARAPIPINSKQINRIHESTVVIHVACQIDSVSRDHIRSPHSVQVVDVDIIAESISLNTKDPRLTHRTRAHSRARRTIIIKETIQPHAIPEDIVAAHDSQTPSGGGAGCAIPCAINKRRKDRVIERRIRREGDGGVGVGLIVCSFGLDLAHEDVASVDELVFVEDMVFDGCAPAILR